MVTFSKDKYVSAKIRSVIKSVSPDEARDILAECNEGNRPVRQSKVRQFASDIKNDNWVLNGEALIFDEHGALADGQHRLLACVEADKPFETMVTMGVPRESRLYVDTGGPRNVRDARNFVGLGEIKNGPVVDAIARIQVRASRNGGYFEKIPSGGGPIPLTNADIVHWTSEHLEKVVEAASLGRSVQTATGAVSPVAAGYAAMVLSEIDPKAAAEFFRLITEGVRAGGGDPIVAMERTIRDNRLRVEQQVAVIFMAWNAWRMEEPRTKFWSKTFATGAEMPKPI